MRIAGILLIVAGLAAFLFGGFSYTSHTRIPNADLVMVAATEDHRVRIPPLFGIAAIFAGSGLMFLRIQRVRKGQQSSNDAFPPVAGSLTSKSLIEGTSHQLEFKSPALTDENRPLKADS
jgi:hypothetical protein